VFRGHLSDVLPSRSSPRRPFGRRHGHPPPPHHGKNPQAPRRSRRRTVFLPPTSPAQSRRLGLIDGVGTLQEILKEKFGKDLKVKKFEAAQSWLKRKLSSQLPGSYSEVINELEVRSIWNKYGL
jgi:hypothetical protein